MENIIYQVNLIIHTHFLKVHIEHLNRVKDYSCLGLAGTIYFMTDILNPSQARFPAFE
jgi:hypothetical protein